MPKPEPGSSDVPVTRAEPLAEDGLERVARFFVTLQGAILDPDDAWLFRGELSDYHVGRINRRELPETVFMDVRASPPAPADPVAAISTSEARTCHQFNLRHFKHTGGTAPNDPLTKGWITFGLAILVPQNLTGQDPANNFDDMQLQLNGAASPDARPTTFYSAIHRVRMYVKSATIVPLL